MTFIIIFAIVFNFGYWSFVLYHDVWKARQSTRPKLVKGSREWMQFILAPGNLQRIAALEHSVELADSPFHPSVCTECKAARSYRMAKRKPMRPHSRPMDDIYIAERAEPIKKSGYTIYNDPMHFESPCSNCDMWHGNGWTCIRRFSGHDEISFHINNNEIFRLNAAAWPDFIPLNAQIRFDRDRLTNTATIRWRWNDKTGIRAYNREVTINDSTDNGRAPAISFTGRP